MVSKGRSLSPSVTTLFPRASPGVIASGASRLADEMLMSASETLLVFAAGPEQQRLVLPELKDIRKSPAQMRFASQNGAAARRGGENMLPKLCNRPLMIISGAPNAATTAVPPSKPAPGSEGYGAISLSPFQISSILGSGE
ncbi:hypothetical protein ACLK19_10065 [Escherichia coli]